MSFSHPCGFCDCDGVSLIEVVLGITRYCRLIAFSEVRCPYTIPPRQRSSQRQHRPLGVDVPRLPTNRCRHRRLQNGFVVRQRPPSPIKQSRQLPRPIGRLPPSRVADLPPRPRPHFRAFGDGDRRRCRDDITY